MPRLFRLLLLLAIAATLVVPGLALAKKKSKHIVKHQTPLEVGQPLRVDVQGGLESCSAGWDCWLLIREPKGGKLLYMVSVDGEGKWKAFLLEEEVKDEEEEAEGEALEYEDEKQFVSGTDGTKVEVTKIPDHECDGYELVEPEEGWDTLGDEWKSLPVLTEEQRIECARRGRLTSLLTVEKMDGEVITENDLRFFLVPPDILPADTFEVEANGYWGASIDGELVGSKSKTGVISIQR
ncbi:MAG: hypothetical protein GY898_27185 [Proteobacteria bacterium]|nr:hypothetical protein [Pseudomonadota bacterium]